MLSVLERASATVTADNAGCMAAAADAVSVGLFGPPGAVGGAVFFLLRNVSKGE